MSDASDSVLDNDTITRSYHNVRTPNLYILQVFFARLKHY